MKYEIKKIFSNIPPPPYFELFVMKKELFLTNMFKDKFDRPSIPPPPKELNKTYYNAFLFGYISFVKIINCETKSARGRTGQMLQTGHVPPRGVFRVGGGGG